VGKNGEQRVEKGDRERVCGEWWLFRVMKVKRIPGI